MKRFAFTMLELVFVIIVIGILAVLAMPNFNRNSLGEAAEQVANHIRYTQHLAMVNDVYNPTLSDWHDARPQISFRTCNSGGNYYYVGSDSNYNGGHIAEDESAVDPLNSTSLYWVNTQCNPTAYPNRNKNLLLKDTYGITNVASSCGATISFDSMGRPYDTFSTVNSYSGQLQNPCVITLTHLDGTATITIEPETGYVSVTY